MKIHCKYDELIEPKKLKVHPKNRNKHSKEQIERLAKLYEYHGIRHPIIVSKRSGYIVAGHGRKAAAHDLGMKEFPVVYQDFDTDEAEYAFIQADNAIALWAELDLSGINSDLPELGPDFDIDMLGIKNFEIDVADKDFEADEDEVPEARPEPKVVQGEVYILGNHRLMCGDSTAITDVERLMSGEKADMVFTDPPYGMAYESNAWDSKNADVKAKRTDTMILNDDTTDAGKDALRLIPAVIANEAHLYVWCRWDCFPDFLEVVKEISKVKSVVVWDKGGPGLGDLQCSYGDSEWAIHGLIGRKPLQERQNCVWQVNRMKGLNMVHPTQKPIELCERGIVNSTKHGEIILDLFGGSGSTLVACEKTDRKCFMMELDPIYCGVILDRWQKFTGKKAHREDGKPWDAIKGE